MGHRRTAHAAGTNILALTLLLSVGCGSTPTLKKEPKFKLDCVAQESGVTASLRGLGVVDANVAWVGGSGGVFAKTSDGGKTWVSSMVPEATELDFRDVEAFDGNTACLMAAGKSARILRTEDGGANWRETYRNDAPGVFLDSMAFWDHRSGIAFSDPVEGAFLVIRTWDGGASWTPVPAKSLPKPLKGEAGFAASGTSVAVQTGGLVWFATGGGGARVFRSADGGETWASVKTPLQNGTPSQGVFSMTFLDSGHGVIVGGDFQYPLNSAANAALTEDGGATWKLVESSSPMGYRSCVAWAQVGSEKILVAVGPSGSDYSLDGGFTWQPLGYEGYHVIAFAGSAGWAAGADGRIARCQAALQ